MTSLDPAFYAIANLGQMFTACVFNCADFLDNRQWKSIIQLVVRPLLINCTSSAHVEIFGNILPPFLKFIDVRLEKEWQAIQVTEEVQSKQDGNNDDDDSAVNDEIVAEKILRDLTRTYVDLVSVIASPADGKPVPKGHEATLVAGTAYAYVLSNQALFGAVFSSLTNIILMKDTTASRKAVTALGRSVPILIQMKRNDVYIFLGQNVMKACLEVFHDGYFQELHIEVITLMGEIYLGLRNVNNTSAYQTLQSLPGMSVEVLQTFDGAFMDHGKTKKERNVVLKDFLRNIKGATLSEAFKMFNTNKATPQLQRNKKRRDVLDEDENEGETGGVFDRFF
ncbi:hypothetical protein HK100_002489 [Physocladia obscura]|uniref:Exportin-5 C-terminal domain-containing protein n=1 Tax=Physocladia obscura TaxID=109957 RepID=A0AAD5SYE0_9FUNG|nr:hypothetical protein HK100_002489 [Physocladia obscura]